MGAEIGELDASAKEKIVHGGRDADGPVGSVLFDAGAKVGSEAGDVAVSLNLDFTSVEPDADRDAELSKLLSEVSCRIDGDGD